MYSGALGCQANIERAKTKNAGETYIIKLRLSLEKMLPLNLVSL